MVATCPGAAINYASVGIHVEADVLLLYVLTPMMEDPRRGGGEWGWRLRVGEVRKGSGGAGRCVCVCL